VLQLKAWGIEDRAEIVPSHVLLTAQQNGGLVAGAFDPQDQMIGFVFGFVGITAQGKFKHCSHMAGVLPSVRRQNVGYTLKLFQRNYVLEQGLLDLITWTYDPLESVNAMLNIAKLGGIARHYSENHYGYWTDELNRGIPTDRFEIEWWIGSPRIDKFLRPERQRTTLTELLAKGAWVLLDTHFDEGGNLHFDDTHLDRTEEVLLLEVPAEYQQIKKFSMDLARAWRLKTREVFQHYFHRGYAVADFVSEIDTERRRNYYVFWRDVPDLAEV
jgi:predicted GNAT superfamily acetyltransferase